MLTNQQKEQNLRVLERIDLSKPIDPKFATLERFKNLGLEKNPLIDGVRTAVEAAKNRFLSNMKEKKVAVTSIFFYENPIVKYGRKHLGWMDIMVQKDFLFVKRWNKEKREMELHDFSKFHLDQTKGHNLPWSLPSKGKGTLRLWIKEGADGKPYVRFPMVKRKDGSFTYPFAVKTILRDRPSQLSLIDLQEALTAFLQVYTAEFVRENPANRQDWDASCMSCRHLVNLGVKDGVMDDLQGKDSPVVLEGLDVMSLSQYGAHQPQAVCMVFKKFVDQQAVEELNRAQSIHYGRVRMEDGSYRNLLPNEVIIGGKVMKVADVRKEATRDRCARCPFYHARVPGFVATARVGRQVIESCVKTRDGWQWVLGAPGKFKTSRAFRIRGIGGFLILGTEQVMKSANLSFVPPVEEVKPETEILKKISQIRHAAFNLEDYTESQFKAVAQLVVSKPKDLSDSLSQKWDKAVAHLAKKISWLREPKREEVPFPVHFYTSEQDGAVQLHVEEVMSGVLFRSREGDYQYHDLTVKEFSHLLDEKADDFVFSALTEGTVFSLVGGTEKDRELAAGSLQYSLQALVRRLLWSVRQSDDPRKALDALTVSPVVKAFISEQLK